MESYNDIASRLDEMQGLRDYLTTGGNMGEDMTGYLRDLDRDIDDAKQDLQKMTVVQPAPILKPQPPPAGVNPPTPGPTPPPVGPPPTGITPPPTTPPPPNPGPNPGTGTGGSPGPGGPGNTYPGPKPTFPVEQPATPPKRPGFLTWRPGATSIVGWRPRGLTVNPMPKSTIVYQGGPGRKQVGRIGHMDPGIGADPHGSAIRMFPLGIKGVRNKNPYQPQQPGTLRLGGSKKLYPDPTGPKITGGGRAGGSRLAITPQPGMGGGAQVNRSNFPQKPAVINWADPIDRVTYGGIHGTGEHPFEIIGIGGWNSNPQVFNN